MNKLNIYRRISILLTIIVLVSGLSLTTHNDLRVTASSAGETPQGKNSSLAGPVEVDYSLYENEIIEIKFKDGYRVRLRDGRPTALNGPGLSSSQANTAFNTVAGGEWFRSHSVSEADLDEMRRQAELNSGEPMPDLNNYFRLKLPEGMEAAEAIALFSKLDAVEAALAIPKSVAPPTPPDYRDPGSTGGLYQQYLDAAPNGVDARYAWAGGGGTGSGIKICDVEYDWNRDHADLPFVPLVTSPPDNSIPADWAQHGTAVLGVLGALDNGWGVTGIAYGATLRFASVKTVLGFNVASAITACSNSLSFGDVILIEQQTSGPNRVE